MLLVRLIVLEPIGRNWDEGRGMLYWLATTIWLLRGEDNGGLFNVFCFVWCLGVVFVFIWWRWYLDLPDRPRGKDFCWSDMGGDKSEEVDDCPPWYMIPAPVGKVIAILAINYQYIILFCKLSTTEIGNLFKQFKFSLNSYSKDAFK